MPTRKAKDIKKALLNKGFRNEEKHHEMFWLYAGGTKTDIRTRLSHGAKECDSFIQGRIRKQIGLETPKEFDEFVDCRMTERAYLQLLVDRKKITLEETASRKRRPEKKKKRRK